MTQAKHREIQIKNVLSLLNLDRPDIKALHDGDLLSCRVGTLRLAAQCIKELCEENLTLKERLGVNNLETGERDKLWIAETNLDFANMEITALKKELHELNTINKLQQDIIDTEPTGS